MPADIIGFAYAATVVAGGLIGYLKAGSVPSLIAGLTFGSLAGFGSYQSSQDPNNVTVLLGTSGALFGLMGYRFYNSLKFMPAGLVASLSILIVMKCTYKLLSKE